MRLSFSKKWGWYALLAWLLAGCGEPPPPAADSGLQGNGTGFEGGEIVATYLESQRAALVATLSRIRLVPDTQLCTAFRSSLSDAINTVLMRMTEPQRERCRRLVRETAAAIIALHTGPRPVKLELSISALSITDPRGRAHPVSAMTELGPNGGIIFHIAALRTLKAADVVALLFHESLHKVPSALAGHAVSQPVSYLEDWREYEGQEGLHVANGSGAAVGLLGEPLVAAESGDDRHIATISRAFREIHGREPSPADVQRWLPALRAGTESYASLRARFELEAYAVRTVEMAIQEAFGRTATPADIQRWAPRVAGQSLSVAALVAQLRAERARAEESVSRAFQEALGRIPTAEEKDRWTIYALERQLDEGALTRDFRDRVSNARNDIVVAFRTSFTREANEGDINYWMADLFNGRHNLTTFSALLQSFVAGARSVAIRAYVAAWPWPVTETEIQEKTVALLNGQYTEATLTLHLRALADARIATDRAYQATLSRPANHIDLAYWVPRLMAGEVDYAAMVAEIEGWKAHARRVINDAAWAGFGRAATEEDYRVWTPAVLAHLHTYDTLWKHFVDYIGPAHVIHRAAQDSYGRSALQSELDTYSPLVRSYQHNYLTLRDLFTRR